jgi:alpha-galactosidase
VGLTREVSWELNRQWLDLLARSGTALFVSAQKEALGPEQEKALREAFAIASVPQPLGEPLDWMESTCPRRWRFGNETVEFNWMGPAGASPFPS